MSCSSINRVMDAISFRTPDRLPRWDTIAPGAGWGMTFPEKWRKWKTFKADVQPIDYYKIDVSEISADEGPFFSGKRLIEKRDSYKIMQDGWGNVVRVKSGGYFFDTLQNAISQPSDLDSMQFENPNDDRRYVECTAVVKHEREAGRVPFATVGGIYCRSQFMRGEDRLLMDMVQEPGFCSALFEKISLYLTEIAAQLLARTHSWETGIWISDDCANNRMPMFSPDMWEKYFLPNYRKMITDLRRLGCKHFFFHSDGNIGPLLDLLLDAGFEGFNPLEPRCGLDLVRLRERYGKRIVFFGGVCNTQVLPGGDKKEIEKAIMPLIELGREGGLIIGSASIGDDIEPQAYDYYISLLDRYSNY